MADTALEPGAGVWLDALRMLLAQGLCFEKKVRRATKHSLCPVELLRHVTVLEMINPLNAELNPICYLLALLAHHFLHVSRIRVKSLTLRLLMSYIYGAPILDVSRSHTTTQHSR